MDGSPKNKAISVTSDALTDVLDIGKPQEHVPIKVFASYWDEWKARQSIDPSQKMGLEELFLRWLQGMGDRPDVGAGIKYMGYMGNYSDLSAASSGSSSGYATTMSNLAEFNKEKKNALIR